MNYKYSSEFAHFCLIFISFQITPPNFNLSETVYFDVSSFWSIDRSKSITSYYYNITPIIIKIYQYHFRLTWIHVDRLFNGGRTHYCRITCEKRCPNCEKKISKWLYYLNLINIYEQNIQIVYTSLHKQYI